MSDNPRDTQERTRLILLSLFPAWLPPAFKVQIAAHQLSLRMPEAGELMCMLMYRAHTCTQGSTVQSAQCNQQCLAVLTCLRAAGHILKAIAGAVLPAERLGHHADLSVADGALQGANPALLCIVAGGKADSVGGLGRVQQHPNDSKVVPYERTPQEQPHSVALFVCR